MTTITSLSSPLLAPPRIPAALASRDAAGARPLQNSAPGPSDRLREAFTQFVGETFFGQMLKAMRSTVGKPSYFHGGRAEDVFRGQLDQALAEHMTEASADRVAEPMFRRQFPHFDATEPTATPTINQLI